MTDAEAREMARDLVRGSIIEDAAAQFIAQVLKEANDSRIKPMRADIAALTAERDALAEKLAKALRALERIELSTDTREQGAIAMATIAELTGGKDE